MPNGHITEDLERERAARRIVDLALKETLRALEETLEHFEEIVLALAEVGLRFPDAKLLDEEFHKETEITYATAAHIYEKFAKSTRAKFKLFGAGKDHAGRSN